MVFLAACGGGGGDALPGAGTTPVDGAGPGAGTPPADGAPPGDGTPPAAVFTVNGDAYTWLGNSRITVPAGFGLLANDVGTATVVSVVSPSANGGTAAVAGTGGSFTYEPPAPSAAGVPFTGPDTFTYTASFQKPDSL